MTQEKLKRDIMVKTLSGEAVQITHIPCDFGGITDPAELLKSFEQAMSHAVQQAYNRGVTDTEQAVHDFIFEKRRTLY